MLSKAALLRGRLFSVGYSWQVVYRLYRDEDFTPLYEIEQACFLPPLRFPRSYMRKLIQSSHTATWIAEEEGRMTGFAIVEWAPSGEQTIAYIQTLEVAAGDRKRGIGEQLLLHLETSARKAGADIVWLHVAEQNSSAIRLYEAHGYLHQGREEGYYDAGVHALTYAKTLADSRSEIPA
jgi:ribosomal protein S18 acetylase RimI-like enzyme